MNKKFDENEHQNGINPNPGELIPWELKEKEEEIVGDKDIIKEQWYSIEKLAYRFVWAIVTDF